MEKANFGQLVSFLFGIANDCLVDIYDVGDYRKIILPMMVIRRFDAVLEPTKQDVLDMKKKLDAAKVPNQDQALCATAGEAFCNSSPYTLSDLKSRTNQQQLKADFILYLDGFSSNVQDIIKKFEFRNQIDKLSEHDVLGLLINKFTSQNINLSSRPVTNAQGVTLPALDNHTMGTVFEEVIRKFNEETNVTDAGRHFTPRDIVELMADLAFIPVKDKIQNSTYCIYDGACGTGGMLTVADQRIKEVAKEYGKKVSIYLYGQENADETYAIAKSDLLVKGEGTQSDNIFFGSTISEDGFAGQTFDFMISNPPFGTPWKTDLVKWGNIKKEDIIDSRFVVNYNGESFSLIPDIGDPQMLFLANNISKMKNDTELGSRIVEVHNGSSLFTGKAGQGPSNLRQYIIEQDLLEAIIAVPEKMFYNTGIGTYLWVLSNKKEARRKGKIQLIDATSFKAPLRKNLGEKNCEITKDIRSQILDLYLAFDEADEKHSKIFDNSEFGYWSVTVERPLRQKVVISPETVKDTLSILKHSGIDFNEKDDGIPVVAPADFLKFMQDNPNVREIKMPKTWGEIKAKEYCGYFMTALIDLMDESPYMDIAKFTERFNSHELMKKHKLSFKTFERFSYKLIFTDPEAEIVLDKDGKCVPDPQLRESEIIPFPYEGGREAFLENEIKPYAHDAYYDENSMKIGYELSFTKYFYQPVQLRTLEEITADIRAIEAETDGLLSEIIGG